MSNNKLVAILSEYGPSSHYTAAIKGRLLSIDSKIQIEEIKNDIKPRDLIATSFLIDVLHGHYPEGTIFLSLVDCNVVNYKEVLIININNRFVITFNNSLLDLLSKPELQIRFKKYHISEYNYNPTFPELEIFTKLAQQIITNQIELNQLTEVPEHTNHKVDIPTIQNNILKGKVIYIDNYQNLITNISQSLFSEIFSRYKSYKIICRNKISTLTISNNYMNEKQGDIVAIFNSNNLLEIAQYNGKASALLGINVGDSILIEFYDN